MKLYKCLSCGNSFNLPVTRLVIEPTMSGMESTLEPCCPQCRSMDIIKVSETRMEQSHA